MLSAKENFFQAAKGLNPDRYANQYEALRLTLHPGMFHNNSPKRGQENIVNAWGVTNSFPADAPGAFPVHTPDKIVIKDIEPKAKLHYLCIPKTHFALLNEMDGDRAEIVKHVFVDFPAADF